MLLSKIKFLKTLDKIIGNFIILFIPKTKNQKTIKKKSIKKILIIRPGGIGDFVLLLPTINYFKKELPHINIDILCEKRNREVSGFTENISSVFLYDKFFDLIKCINIKYDIIIDTEQWHKLSAIICYLIKSSIKIGYATNNRKKIFTHKIKYSHEKYEIYSFFDLLSPILDKKIIFDNNTPFIKINHTLSKNLDSIIQGNENKIISIAPGATIKEKLWDTNNFIKIIKELTKKNYLIILLGSKNDIIYTNKIKQKCSVINLVNKTSLKESSKIIQISKILITSDSGLMHIAKALATPTISLFGASIEKKWAPQGSNHISINKHIKCSPCTKFGNTPKCKNKIKCLSLIKPNDVINAINKILK